MKGYRGHLGGHEGFKAGWCLSVCLCIRVCPLSVQYKRFFWVWVFFLHDTVTWHRPAVQAIRSRGYTLWAENTMIYLFIYLFIFLIGRYEGDEAEATPHWKISYFRSPTKQEVALLVERRKKKKSHLYTCLLSLRLFVCLLFPLCFPFVSFTRPLFLLLSPCFSLQLLLGLVSSFAPPLKALESNYSEKNVKAYGYQGIY